MTDDTKNCDEVAEYLEQTFPELKDAVLVIHTKNNGEITESTSGKSKEVLEKLRKESNEIDSWDSPYKAVVSVLMLKEGWDVRNVTTIVGLRAYSSKSNILPEQTLGRGLRRIYPGINIKEYLSVIGTDAFMDFVESIQSEGVELELEFANFLETCEDVVSFTRNYFSVNFRIDYINARGEISNYYPDFIVKTLENKIYIIETKGLEDLDVPLKIERLKQWCDDINNSQSKAEYDFVFVDEESFYKYNPMNFTNLINAFRQYKE